MVRYLISFLALFVSLALAPVQAFAETTESVLYPSPGFGGTPLLLGQQHFYTVTVRGNQSATVTARIAFGNNGTQPLSRVSFTSKVALENLVAYEQVLPKTCLLYDVKNTSPTPACLQYGDPDYSLQYFPDPFRPAKYTKLTTSEDSQRYTITLPTPLNPGSSIAIILIYKSNGYVKNWLGLYRYSFTTLAAEDPVETARVSIQGDSDLYLSEGTSSVAYKNSDLPVADAVQGGREVGSSELDRLTSSIGISGGVYKEGRNIAAGESFTVTGTYAKSLWRLNLGKIVMALAAVLVILLIMYRVIYRRRPGSATQQHPVQHLVNEGSTELVRLFHSPILSWCIASLIVGGLFLLEPWLSTSVAYQSYQLQFVIFFIPLLALLIPLSFTAVASLYGGWKLSVYTFVSFTVWTLILLLVGSIILSSTRRSPITPLDLKVNSVAEDASPATAAPVEVQTDSVETASPL